jgi:preprotein translocase subunit YajC
MSHTFFTLLAQTTSGAGTTAPGAFNPNGIVWMLGIFAIFYFLMIRPQSQRQKQQDAMIKAVKTGDRIVTSSGIHGMVSNVKDTTVIVKIADNVKIELDKSSIGNVLKRDEDEPAAAAS